MSTMYEAIGGDEGALRLAHAWHERVLADEVVSHAFHHGFKEDHTERLAAYWAEALGGPAVFSQSLGSEAEVVRMHSGNGEHDEMDRRAVAAFGAALVDAGVAAEHHERLVEWFRQANEYVNHRYPRPEDVPDDLVVRVLQNE